MAAVTRNRTRDGKCQELVFIENRYYCGFVLDPPDKDQMWWKRQLCIGVGCCSNLNSDRSKFVLNHSSRLGDV